MKKSLVSTWTLLGLVGCAHGPRQVALDPAPAEATEQLGTSDDYAELAHDRRHQGIAFLEDMLGMPASSTEGCALTDTHR